MMTLSTDSSIPYLRKCLDCGLEAYTIYDLDLFVTSPRMLYDKANLCKKCQDNRYYERKYNPKPPKPKPTYLRKCRECGLEAHTKSDLELFKKGVGLYGRRLICKECNNAKTRKGGIYYEKSKIRVNQWIEENKERYREICKKKNMRKITFNGKQIFLKENPRTNICSECGKCYPEELDVQTTMHHDIYDKNDPLAHTRELCTSCHSLHHHEQNRRNLKVKIPS